MTNGHGGYITPSYVYEHDYKVRNNNYVMTDPNYSWSSNLPGAYRDTRASDSNTWLDFTIGAMFTWRFNASATYTIQTDVNVSQSSLILQSTATLAAQVLPNDGAFSSAAAAAGGGCSFPLDPTGGNTLPPVANGGNYAWCGGVGHGAGSQTAAYSYISLQPFGIIYTGVCRDWVLGKGSTSCPR